MAVSLLFCTMVSAQENISQVVDDYVIIKDEVVEGVRCITAAPSAKVCSKQIDIRIKDDVILQVVYTRGCEGNAKGIGALIKDMTVDEAIKKLSQSKFRSGFHLSEADRAYINEKGIERSRKCCAFPRSIHSFET